ncbi:MAG: cytochrome b/b6 domain-containing protein [Rhodospirillales bacterium]
MADNNSESAPRGRAGGNGVRVWDLPVRLFHWTLLAAVVTSVATGLIGGLWQMDLHVVSGCVVLGLVLFRVLWGLVGGRHARFRAFVKGPAMVARYAVDFVKGRAVHTAGHNPLGGWSVVLILLALAVQAGTGLFANDDIFLEAPLAKYAGKALSDRLTGIHHLMSTVLYVLVAAHVAAVALHWWKGDNLVKPMITGIKPGADPAAADGPTRWVWLAAAVIVAAAPVAWILSIW